MLLKPNETCAVESSAGLERNLVTAIRHFFLTLAISALAIFPAAAGSGASGSGNYVVRFAAWSDADERAYSDFISAIGRSGCNTVDACLKGSGNTFHASDSPDAKFYSDCAQLPYVL